MSGISLWLSPPSPVPGSGSQEHPLVPYLARLSSENSTPLFRPHLTLLSDHLVPSGLTDRELIETVQRGVERWAEARSGTSASTTGSSSSSSAASTSTGAPLEIVFKDVRQGPLFYQCVLAACEELDPLTGLHETMKQVFRVPEAPTYFPHLSLIYGDLSSEKKDQIVSRMIKKGEVVDNDKPGEVKIVGVNRFRPREILIMETRGGPETWKEIGRVEIPGQEDEAQGIFGWAASFLPGSCVIS